MDGFTAFFGTPPDRGRLMALATTLRSGFTPIARVAQPVPCANVLSHLNFLLLIETG